MVPASYLMVRALYDGWTHGLSLPTGGLRARSRRAIQTASYSSQIKIRLPLPT